MAENKPNQIIIPPVYYGVWRPFKGWLKVTDENNDVHAFADLHKEVAVATAKWIGQGARVEFVDDSLFRLEITLLEADQVRRDAKQPWHISVTSKLKFKRS
jgi:hypothetical protein